MNGVISLGKCLGDRFYHNWTEHKIIFFVLDEGSNDQQEDGKAGRNQRKVTGKQSIGQTSVAPFGNAQKLPKSTFRFQLSFYFSIFFF